MKSGKSTLWNVVPQLEAEEHRHKINSTKLDLSPIPDSTHHRQTRNLSEQQLSVSHVGPQNPHQVVGGRVSLKGSSYQTPRRRVECILHVHSDQYTEVPVLDRATTSCLGYLHDLINRVCCGPRESESKLQFTQRTDGVDVLVEST